MKGESFTECGIAAIKVKDEIVYIFAYPGDYHQLQEIVYDNLYTNKGHSAASIFGKMTKEERENAILIQLFTMEQNNTNVTYIEKENLNWILYSFKQYFKPKYNNLEKQTIIKEIFVSNGEEKIAKWLDEHNIRYEREYSFPDLLGQYEPLRFDFKIIDKPVVIEYQGQQHYMPVYQFGGESGFKRQLEYDNLKRDYCLKHNLQLIEIPYHCTQIDYYLEALNQNN